MKNDRASGRTAGMALSLFVAAWLPAAATADSCATLTQQALLYMQEGVSENPRKPQDVAASDSLIAAGFSVSWNIPSNRPAGAVTGHCVQVTHADCGDYKEHCRDGSSASWAATGCATDDYCTGTFDLEVAFEDNCELEDHYSDFISHAYEH